MFLIITENNNSTGYSEGTREDRSTRESSRLTGTVKWFNAKFGYGFITRHDTHEDVFVLNLICISECNRGEQVFIPRIKFTPSDTNLPFTLKRRQFPILLAYAMTINKSQGQTFDHVGVFLDQPVFAHGQLYVA